MDSCTRTLAVLGAVSGFLAVALGAFAAHGLKARLEPELLTIFETGARYQIYHALAMFVAAWAATVARAPLAHWAGRCFVLGTVVFSGSLYALALTGLRWLGAITPFGGVLLLAGWVLLALAFLRRQDA
jgi:uncharacterized membrane protein YgdD (TMEM256/DUF423 family)